MKRINPEDLVAYKKYKPTFDRLKKYQPKTYQRLIRYQLNIFIELGTLKLKRGEKDENLYSCKSTQDKSQ